MFLVIVFHPANVRAVQSGSVVHGFGGLCNPIQPPAPREVKNQEWHVFRMRACRWRSTLMAAESPVVPGSPLTGSVPVQCRCRAATILYSPGDPGNACLCPGSREGDPLGAVLTGCRTSEQWARHACSFVDPSRDRASGSRSARQRCCAPCVPLVYVSIPQFDALSNSIQQLGNCCFKLAFEHEQKSVTSRDESSEARTPAGGYRPNTRQVAGGRWPGFRRSRLSGHDHSPNMCGSGS